MAWTWSAPHRGRISGAAAVLSSHRFLNSAIQRAAMTLGRGDTGRGLCIGFAAFLTITGAAAPNISSTTMAALLYISGATLVLFAAWPFAGTQLDSDEDVAEPQTLKTPPTRSITPVAGLHELLNQRPATSATDRAAFARLTAHMSHELRTPLNAILGFSEMMSNEVFGPLGSSCYASYARDIHASGISLLKSADDALAITALLTANENQQKLAHTPAASTAADALAFHAPAFAANGMSTHCTVDTDVEIAANPQAVRQLLINLIADATMGAAPGAHVMLASRCVGSELEICLTVSGQSVTDTATGESFSLLLARTLAELCGAKLTVTATPSSDRYATVRFMRVVQNDFFG
jgi:signal transduction histidine kinase